MPSSRAATSAYAEKDEDSAIYERGRSGAVLGRGDAEVRMAALYRLAAPPPAGVQDAARGCTGYGEG